MRSQASKLGRRINVLPEQPYNPLDKKNLGVSVADALLDRVPVPLPPASFVGAGVYAIYYTGAFPEYAAIASSNRQSRFLQPIYVGRAVPPGRRKGGFSSDAGPGRVLASRLKKHASSIEVAKNLKLEDFWCRFLVVDDIWIPLGESLLIDRFSPIWNKVVEGFGNNDPGKNRYNQARSPWDTIHPGRPWAEAMQPNPMKSEEILDQILAKTSTSAG
ncbi:MAG: Eco29kI family restriction endonuclease [Gammaproteobacteria bacterium]|nr:Eco29kI family restriction endonuclease [Gammaproteobacteria bacterium]